MTNNDEDTSRQAESLWRSDDWAALRWAREHSTPQQIARHLLDPQWRNRDYNALDELVEMTHDADLSSLSEDDLETLAASSLPELRQSVIRYKAQRRIGGITHSEEGSTGIPQHPAGRSTAGSGHRPGYGSGGPERSGTRIMSACTTIGSRHAAYDGRELREFWTRAKRRMSRQDFEKLRPPSAIRQ